MFQDPAFLYSTTSFFVPILMGICGIGITLARFFVVALLDLILGADEMELIHGELFKRHSDYHKTVGEIGNGSYLDALVGLWHMLHFTNYSDYGVLKWGRSRGVHEPNRTEWRSARARFGLKPSRSVRFGFR
ncbi:hypothetical protein Hanom_Chr14g01273261 [Helianthus anomalus]